MIRIKRVYDPPSRSDGTRILVDRVWPRGLSREEARIDVWMKELAPSTGLRKWFGHAPSRWREFRERFFRELHDRQHIVDEVLARRETVTLLYGAREGRFNNAAALLEYLEARKRATTRRKAA